MYNTRVYTFIIKKQICKTGNSSQYWNTSATISKKLRHKYVAIKCKLVSLRRPKEYYWRKGNHNLFTANSFQTAYLYGFFLYSSGNCFKSTG